MPGLPVFLFPQSTSYDCRVPVLLPAVVNARLPPQGPHGSEKVRLLHNTQELLLVNLAPAPELNVGDGKRTASASMQTKLSETSGIYVCLAVAVAIGLIDHLLELLATGAKQEAAEGTGAAAHPASRLVCHALAELLQLVTASTSALMGTGGPGDTRRLF